MCFITDIQINISKFSSYFSVTRHGVERRMHAKYQSYSVKIMYERDLVRKSLSTAGRRIERSRSVTDTTIRSILKETHNKSVFFARRQSVSNGTQRPSTQHVRFAEPIASTSQTDAIVEQNESELPYNQLESMDLCDYSDSTSTDESNRMIQATFVVDELHSGEAISTILQPTKIQLKPNNGTSSTFATEVLKKEPTAALVSDILMEFDPILSKSNENNTSISNVVLLSEAIKVWPSTRRPVPDLIAIGVVPHEIEPIRKTPPIYKYDYVSSHNRPHECIISNQVYRNMINTLTQTSSTANPANLLNDVDAHANADEIKIRDIDMCSLCYEHFGSLDFE